MYDPSDREKLSEPRRPTRFGANVMQINRMRTRSQRQVRTDSTSDEHDDDYQNTDRYDTLQSERRLRNQQRNQDRDHSRSNQRSPQKKPQDQQRVDQPSDTLCIGCWTYGHSVEECTKTGAQIAIDAFLQRCSDQTKQEIKTAYIAQLVIYGCI